MKNDIDIGWVNKIYYTLTTQTRSYIALALLQVNETTVPMESTRLLDHRVRTTEATRRTLQSFNRRRTDTIEDLS